MNDTFVKFKYKKKIKKKHAQTRADKRKIKKGGLYQ